MKKFLFVLCIVPFVTIGCKSLDTDESSISAIQDSCENKYINTAIPSISPEELTAVSDLLTTACKNTQRTELLFSDNYGWKGSSQNFSSFFYKYYETTAHQTLYTKTGIAMQFPKIEGDFNYAQLLYKAYTDPIYRNKHYRLPPNIQLSNVKDLTGFNEDYFSISYTSSISNKVKIAFISTNQVTVYNTTLTFTKINDYLFAFTERSYEKGRLVRRAISFLVKEYTGIDKLIQLEQREVNYTTDRGSILSQVKTIMYKLDVDLATSLYNAIVSVQKEQKGN